MTNNSSSRRKRRPTSNTSSTQRVTVGGISGLVIVIIVLIAQYGFGIDVLQEDTDGSSSGQPVIEQPAVAPPPGNLVAIPGGFDGGWFQIYFTEPENSTPGVYEGSPVENALISWIDGAGSTIDPAIYELKSQPVTDALIAAHDRGVRVRIVTYGEHGMEHPDTTMDQIEDAGIPLESDGFDDDFMHNKFIVIDGLYVWTGSTNVTFNGFYRNNNNAIMIRSSRLAQNYTAEFEELFAGKFGKSSPGDVPNPVISIDGTRIETIFESEGYYPERLIELLRNAHKVEFMAFAFTNSFSNEDRSVSIMDVLVEEVQSGQLDARGIIEASQRSYVEDLVCGGLTIRTDTNPGVFHHKVFIIDDSIVAVGSFNFSRSASNSNDENVLIIESPVIAEAYQYEFDRRWNESNPLVENDDC